MTKTLVTCCILVTILPSSIGQSWTNQDFMVHVMSGLNVAVAHLFPYMEIWVVVSKICYFQPYLGKWSNLTNIFSDGLKPLTRNYMEPTGLGLNPRLIHCICDFSAFLAATVWNTCVWGVKSWRFFLFSQALLNRLFSFAAPVLMIAKPKQDVMKCFIVFGMLTEEKEQGLILWKHWKRYFYNITLQGINISPW